jgi:hypothetical protein
MGLFRYRINEKLSAAGQSGQWTGGGCWLKQKSGEGKMKNRYGWIAFMALAILFTGCATKQDFERLEGKIDQLIRATHRSALEEIFGEQASQITVLVNDLDAKQKQNFEDLQQDYVNGTMAVEEVQQQMLNILGNNDRVVSTQRGIYIRNLEGSKIKAISNGTKIENCRPMPEEKIPPEITEKEVLNQYSWGQGELDGKAILFPWELTISSFTKEIAEHTARRTAEEFIRMGGEEEWRRPIKIQISTEKDDLIKVTTNEEDNEVYFEYQSINYDIENTDGTSSETVGEPQQTDTMAE